MSDEPTLAAVRAYLVDHGPARLGEVQRALAPPCECPDCGVAHTDPATRAARAAIKRHVRTLENRGSVVADPHWRYEVVADE